MNRKNVAMVMLLIIPILLAATDASAAGSARPAWDYFFWGFEDGSEALYDAAGLIACAFFGPGAIGCGAMWIL